MLLAHKHSMQQLEQPEAAQRCSTSLRTQGSGLRMAVWKASIHPWKCSCCTSSWGMVMNVALQNTLQMSLMNSGTCRTAEQGHLCLKP